MFFSKVRYPSLLFIGSLSLIRFSSSFIITTSSILTKHSAFATSAILNTQIRKKMSEVDAAAIAASTDPAVNPYAPTFFDKIVSKEIPANVIYEDDKCMAFRDINPQGPVHFLVIPKNKDGLNRLSSAREDHIPILGHLMYTAQKVAHQEGLGKDGFRVVVNDGQNGCQSVYHLHLHVIGGRPLGWPPG
jgi:histidine triad (HIT) family protein